ncbi:MAG TPA: hypothetical protein VJ997_10520 [Longimicrobiales bacterium]|nr:hypothetical protein [Longimicrobiales bacterium]
MNVDDRDLPIHEMSRVEERERLLAETLAHAEAQEAQYRVLPADEPRYRRGKTVVALLLFVVAAVLWVAPPRWVAGPPPPSAELGDLERGLRAAVYLQATQVEVYRLRNGRLPEELSELPTHLPGLSLVRSNSRVFQILGRRPGGEVLVYDSAHPSPGFASAASGWTAQGTP